MSTGTITVYQQAVVGFQYPTEQEDRERENKRALAQLASEICERLEEMEEIKHMASGAFIARLSNVRAISPKAYRIAIQLMHGNLSRMRSYAAQAEERGISRQTVFLEFKNEVDRIAHIFPEIADAMRDFHDSALSHEDPMDTRQALQECGVRV